MTFFGFTQRTYLTLMRYRRGMTLGVRGVVFDKDGRVFLVRHGYTPGWHFPGGGVEPGETIHDSLVRELDEEGGIALDGAAELFGLYHNRRAAPRDHVAVFICRDWHETRERTSNMEIRESGFYAVDALPEGTTEPTRRRLAEILDGAPPAATW